MVHTSRGQRAPFSLFDQEATLSSRRGENGSVRQGVSVEWMEGRGDQQRPRGASVWTAMHILQEDIGQRGAWRVPKSLVAPPSS